jgi:diacylglycerol kinase (ATP)
MRPASVSVRPVPRPLVIANPTAGRGHTERDIHALLGAVRERVGEVDLVVTDGAGHAADLARRGAASGRELIIALGGDGTLHEIANGVLAEGLPAGPAVALLAVGTGSDFGRSLGLPHDTDAYLDALASGRRREVDVGRARYVGRDGEAAACYWINVLSAGIGGLVDRYVAALPDRLSGRLAYGLATVGAVLACHRSRLRCRATLDDGGLLERDFDGYALAICNGHTFGGGMRIAPGASLDDALFDVITVETPTRVTMLRHFVSIYSGQHLAHSGVGRFACRRLDLEPLSAPRRGGVFPLDVDGEALGDVPLEVEVMPRALTVLA